MDHIFIPHSHIVKKVPKRNISEDTKVGDFKEASTLRRKHSQKHYICTLVGQCIKNVKIKYILYKKYGDQR